MSTAFTPIKLTSGGFPELMASPRSPRGVADEPEVINLIDTKHDEDETLLNDLLDDGSIEANQYSDDDDDEQYDDGAKDSRAYSGANYTEKMHNPSPNEHHSTSMHTTHTDDDCPIQLSVRPRKALVHSPIGRKELEHYENNRFSGEEKKEDEFDVRFREGAYSYNDDNDEDVEDDEDDDESASSQEPAGKSDEEDDESVGTLLTRAHDRIHLQDTKEEIAKLKEIIDRKNQELENLAGQLRRAVSTKCDLVLAHTELELHHESDMIRKDNFVSELKKVNISLLEEQSEIEKNLLNEIMTLTEQMKQAEAKHKGELDDWKRMHKNELNEKDFQIAKLREEIRRLKNADPNEPVAVKKPVWSGILTKA
jgi:hypothetical protein